MLTSNIAADTNSPDFPVGPLLSARDEITRVREHFLGAILAVGRAPTSGLSSGQRLRRRQLLRSLIRYAVAGRFPKNVSRPGRLAPTFVDHEGTRCAVAYLMEGAGAASLVDRVVGTSNHAFVPELALDAMVSEWLLAQGVSVEEAARIQPSYCYVPADACVCDHAFGYAAELFAGVIQADGTVLVDQIFATSGEIAVGDSLEVSWSLGHEVGTRVLADYDENVGANLYYAFVDGDTLSTAGCYVDRDAPWPPATLDMDLVLDIRAGAECHDVLEAADADWVEATCDYATAPPEDGCSFAGLPAEETALLYALMAGLAIARRRRDASKRQPD